MRDEGHLGRITGVEVTSTGQKREIGLTDGFDMGLEKLLGFWSG
jgi:hypothetical protein